MADNDSDFAQPLAALSVQNPVTVNTSSSVTLSGDGLTVTGIITGATGVIVSGTGFSCVRNSAGSYTITFTTPFTSTPVVHTTPIATAEIPTLSPAPSTTAFTVVFYTVAAVATDTDFNFTATAVR